MISPTHLPSVSVIVPVHNGASTIGLALASAIQQDYPIQEIIVIDDGSTDTSLQALSEFIHERRPVVRAHAHPSPLGLANTYNHGIEMASSDYVVFLHQDVVLPSVREMRFLMTPFSNSPDVLATTPTEIHPYDAWATYPFWQKCLFSRFLQTEYNMFMRGSRQMAGRITGKFDAIRKEALQAIGGFDAATFHTAGEDLDITLKLQRHGQILTSGARIIHHHKLDNSFGFTDYLYKHYQYAMGHGAVLRKSGLGSFSRTVSAFHRELIFLSCMTPGIWPLGWCMAALYALLYTRKVYTHCWNDPRVLTLPLANLLTIVASLAGAMVGWIRGKQN